MCRQDKLDEQISKKYITNFNIVALSKDRLATYRYSVGEREHMKYILQGRAQHLFIQ